MPKTSQLPDVTERVEYMRSLTPEELRFFAVYMCGRAPALVAEYMTDHPKEVTE